MIRRNIAPNLLDALADTPVVLLNGARQTGKSTLAKSIAEKEHPAAYITLDDYSALSAARHDPAGFLAGFEGPVIIDEIQKAPNLFPAIKAMVDRDRQPGRFLLTGSANVFLLPRLSESLAGRMEILNLWPFSQGELGGIREEFVDALFAHKLPSRVPDSESQANILGRILIGGYPEAVRRSSIARRKAWFDSYITTLLHRDVRDLANIEGMMNLPRLLSLLAIRVPTFLNFAELSRTAAIAQSTLKRYMSLLEAIFLIQNIPAWSKNPGKRLVKAPKLVISDTALKAHLTGSSIERMTADGSVGGYLENFVIMELRKQISWSRIRPRMFHFRTQSGQEVDVVLEDLSGRLVGIEVKTAAAVGAEDFKGLRALAESAGKNFHRGIVVYTGTGIVPFGQNLHAVPVTALWHWRLKS
jgi:predicted AAA+ superfamily ATPase